MPFARVRLSGSVEGHGPDRGSDGCSCGADIKRASAAHVAASTSVPPRSAHDVVDQRLRPAVGNDRLKGIAAKYVRAPCGGANARQLEAAN